MLDKSKYGTTVNKIKCDPSAELILKENDVLQLGAKPESSIKYTIDYFQPASP
jgi:hypothetical protein